MNLSNTVKFPSKQKSNTNLARKRHQYKNVLTLISIFIGLFFILPSAFATQQCIDTSASAPTFINYWNYPGGTIPPGARHSNAKNFRQGDVVFSAGYCAEKADNDPQENDVYSAHTSTRQNLSAEKIGFLEHLYSGLIDPDITGPIETAFPGKLQTTLDDMFQYLSWYYTHWDQDYTEVQSMIDYRADANSFTAAQKTAFENASVLALNRSKGIKGETQYPKMTIYWLYNETNAGRQDIIVPEVFVTGSNCQDADHGDAPQSYGDASHALSDNLYIGSLKPDAEASSAYSYNALGDDIDGSNDNEKEDDGAPINPAGQWRPYLFPILKQSATSYSVDIKVTNTSGNVASLFAWIDFNKNGTFDNNESATTLVNSGLNNDIVTLNWNSIPNDIQIGTTFIRLRLTTDSAVTLNTPSNKANDGEVEDYTIAIAQDIPPSSPNVTVLKDISPRSCDVVLFEDDFSDLPSGTYFGEHRANRSDIRNWTVTGGGPNTYARTVHLNTTYAATVGYTIDDYGTSIYLGNGAVRRVYPPIDGDLSFDATNRLLTPIEAIEIRDIPDDDPQGTDNNQSHWGPESVVFSHTFPTKVGKVYRLYFKALPELGEYESGIIRIDTPAGSVHVKTPGESDQGVVEYGIEFTADSTSSTISFVNYGHIGSRVNGWCAPWREAWCTVGGTTLSVNEVTIDDVVITQSSDCNACNINDANTGIYSSASVQVNSDRLNTNTRLYQAQFDVATWEGYLLSYDLKTANDNDRGNTKDIKWDAANKIPNHAQRKIFSYDPLLSSANKGIEFTWDNLSANQKTLLATGESSNGASSGGSCDNIPEWVQGTPYTDGTIVKYQGIRYKVVREDDVAWKDPSLAANNIANHSWGWWETLGPCGSSSATDTGLLNWVRGDQSNEKTSANPSGIFHKRNKLLGDIIHSSPRYAGKYDDYGYTKLSGTEGTSYPAFLSAKRSRTDMVYVGANDGMLHGFDANTGVERFAYIPNNVMAKFIKISDPNYGCAETDCIEHQALVDGELTVDDAYINNTWKSVLLGTLGAGGKGIFALDVSNPASFTSSNVMWELSASQAPDNTSTYADHLGETIPAPSIIRLNNGAWAALISNGYNSANHQAVLFLIDLSNGQLIKAINTEQGNASTPNGLSSPIPIDTNGDRITDYIYAGDLLGNLWKFDISNSNPNNWSVAYTASSAPAPLFTACETNACTRTQAITAKPQVGKHPNGGYMVYFGTGKYFDPSDNVSGTPDIETLYGIRDNGSIVASVDDLALQTVLQDSNISSNLNARITSNNVVDYSTKKGWRLKLLKADGTAEGERIISQTLLRGGKLIFTTLIPPENCGWNGSSWLMEINAINGQRLAVPSLDINSDRQFNKNDEVSYNQSTKVPSGLQKESLGLILHSPIVLNHTSNSEGKYVSGSTGVIGMFRERSSRASGRQSWRQIR